MVVTIYDTYNILSKVYKEGAFLDEAINSTLIEEKNRAIVHKTCFGVLDNDIYLNYILSKLSPKSPKPSIKLILKISLYLIIFLEKAPYAVTKGAVDLVKKMGKGGVSGYVNGVLRNYLRTEIALPTEKIEYLSTKYSYPLFVTKILVKDYGEEIAEKIMSYREVNSYVRFKTEEEAKEYLKDFEYKDTVYPALKNVRGLKVNEDFKNGLFTFQSIGSVAICEMTKGEGILYDVCSAPGGKSVLLSQSFKEVYSSDIHEHRVKLIESYAKRMGRDNIKAFCQDGTKLNEEFIDKFDTVLVDSPCSGFGVTVENPDIKLNRTYDDLLEINKTQKELLQNNSKYVKVGGYLCYSTCSVLKLENEKVIVDFLKNNGNFVLEDVNCKLEGVKNVGTTFLPYLSSGAGFYFARLKRVK